jgi:F-type H+-transporting ATPase subunit beta
VFNVSLNLSTLQFTGLKGVLVDIKDTIKGFNMIIDGDHLPESAFNLKVQLKKLY